jgi:hypothetical protein
MMGFSCLIDELKFEVRGDNLIVFGWTPFVNLNQISNHLAIQQLSNIEDSFNYLMQNSEPLKIFISSKKLQFILLYDDAGKGSISICSKQDNEITFHLNLN